MRDGGGWEGGLVAGTQAGCQSWQGLQSWIERPGLAGQDGGSWDPEANSER